MTAASIDHALMCASCVTDGASTRHQWRITQMLLLAGVVLTFGYFGSSGAVFADGPVDATSLPGGVNVSDSDSGAGEQWGRAGGRDIQYQVIDPDLFSALSFGVVDGTLPGAAFDNSIDGLVDGREIMTFNGAGSDLPNGVAQWTGAAQITLVASQSGTYTLPTRFTLTVTDHLGDPVPLSFVPGEVDPGIDVKNDTNGTFIVNLFFEARYSAGIPAGSMIDPGNDTWMPLLDLFDLLDTGIGQDGFAHTSVSTGFYFTIGDAGGGLSLEQHDETVNEKLDEILVDTDFLTIEWIGRIPAIEDRQAVIENLIRNLPTGQIPQNVATTGDVDNAAGRVQEAVTTTLLTLWGLLPCPPEQQALCDQFSLIAQLSNLSSQDSVDAVLAAVNALDTSGLASQESVNALRTAVDELAMELESALKGELNVEVVEISGQSDPRHRQWLVKTTRDGRLVNAELSKLLAIRTTRGAVPVVEDVTMMATVTPVSTGLQDVFLDIASGASDTRAYQFEVHLDGDTPAHGSALLASSALGGVR